MPLHPNAIKIVKFILCAFALFAPFSKGGNNEDEESRTLKYAVRGTAAQMSKDSYLNEVVDSFFASSDDGLDALSLKDEIKILANTEVLKSFLVSVRRQLHRHPEIMYQGTLPKYWRVLKIIHFLSLIILGCMLYIIRIFYFSDYSNNFKW